VKLSFNAANDEVANRPFKNYKLLGGNRSNFPSTISILVIQLAIV